MGVCFSLLFVQCLEEVACQGLFLQLFQTHEAQKHNLPWPPELSTQGVCVPTGCGEAVCGCGMQGGVQRLESSKARECDVKMAFVVPALPRQKKKAKMAATSTSIPGKNPNRFLTFMQTL